jgi:hypothetical protein
MTGIGVRLSILKEIFLDNGQTTISFSQNYSLGESQMTKEIKIIIENRLILEKRAMNVYHHATRSSHMIGHNSSVTLPLQTVIEHDYLHISIVTGPGNMERKSIANLPSWVDFDFLSEGNVSISHSGKRILLKIPPGLPGWQLKLTRSTSQNWNSIDRVIISDEQQEYL